MTSARLEALPEEHLVITDEGEAETLLFDLGLTDRFMKAGIGAHVLQAVSFDEHPTHHILAMYTAGHSSRGDNGYLIYCLPKSKLSDAGFSTIVETFLGDLKPAAVGVVQSAHDSFRN